MSNDRDFGFGNTPDNESRLDDLVSDGADELLSDTLFDIDKLLEEAGLTPNEFSAPELQRALLTLSEDELALLIAAIDQQDRRFLIDNISETRRADAVDASKCLDPISVPADVHDATQKLIDAIKRMQSWVSDGPSRTYDFDLLNALLEKYPKPEEQHEEGFVSLPALQHLLLQLPREGLIHCVKLASGDTQNAFLGNVSKAQREELDLWLAVDDTTLGELMEAHAHAEMLLALARIKALRPSDHTYRAEAKSGATFLSTKDFEALVERAKALIDNADNEDLGAIGNPIPPAPVVEDIIHMDVAEAKVLVNKMKANRKKRRDDPALKKLFEDLQEKLAHTLTKIVVTGTPEEVEAVVAEMEEWMYSLDLGTGDIADACYEMIKALTSKQVLSEGDTIIAAAAAKVGSQALNRRHPDDLNSIHGSPNTEEKALFLLFRRMERELSRDPTIAIPQGEHHTDMSLLLMLVKSLVDGDHAGESLLESVEEQEHQRDVQFRLQRIIANRPGPSIN